MLRKIHLKHMSEALPFLLVVLLGTGIFLLDYFELVQPIARETVLAVISLAKSVWFIRFMIRKIRETTAHEFYFHEFMAFIGISTVLFVLSYSLDFFCLYQIRPTAFHGLPALSNIPEDFATFFYFSVTNFTTAGLGDIIPNCASARLFIAGELITSFFFTIFIIANFATLRESFIRKQQQ